MPEDSRKVYATQSVRISKPIEAPVRYAFDWLTDFRGSDGRFSRARPRFRMLRVAPDRIVRIRSSRTPSEHPAIAVELIRLRPPNAWHVDQIDEDDLETVEYRLTRRGPRSSKLTLEIVERWMTRKHPTRAEWTAGAARFWDVIVAELEKSYRAGRPARG